MSGTPKKSCLVCLIVCVLALSGGLDDASGQKAGGRLVIAQGTDAESLDTIAFTASPTAAISEHITETLVRLEIAENPRTGEIKSSHPPVATHIEGISHWSNVICASHELKRVAKTAGGTSEMRRRASPVNFSAKAGRWGFKAAQKLQILVDDVDDSTNVKPSLAALLRKTAISRSRVRRSYSVAPRSWKGVRWVSR